MVGWSPLTKELLPPGENITDVLDYEEDPEVTEVIANILLQTDDVEMQDVNPPLSFELEVSHTGYDHNLVWASEDTGPGLIPRSPKVKTGC